MPARAPAVSPVPVPRPPSAAATGPGKPAVAADAASAGATPDTTPHVAQDKTQPTPQPEPTPSASPTAPVAADAAAPTEQLPNDAAAPTEQVSADAEDPDASPDWQAFVPTDVADHLATMDRAARDSGCGVPWHLLAAISRVESDFGRNMATSSAGAVGYGQFLPSSWEAFGNEGNVYDYRDALPAIATYLCQSGVERDPRAALFAYNHADWYVDMVLNLAVRYDRLAPGAPTPAVLGVSPADDAGLQIRYAVGRDVRLQARARSVDSSDWLGVPWHGRTPGSPLSFSALETTAVAMVRGGLGVKGSAEGESTAGGDELTGLANQAWDAGLLPMPVEAPRWHVAADRQPAEQEAWIGQIRSAVKRGLPLVALVDAAALPGHALDDADGDQPVVIVGETADGLVYSDPSFSTSLGYGLELSDADFFKAWQGASTPLQALAFTPRPQPLPRDIHLNVAEPPPAMALVLPTPTPIPPPALTEPASPRAEDVSPSVGGLDTPDVGTDATGDRELQVGRGPTAQVDASSHPVASGAVNGHAAASTAGNGQTAAASGAVDGQAATAAGGAVNGQPAASGSVAPRGAGDDDRSWMFLLGAAAFLGAAFAFRRGRARRLS
jgi:hypothetical protein